uniref:Uncharacterized protein n=1 Tax=uncultured prokaryote TaxID=198431 RepID=A0A0H5Q4W0_9ZZZZ|nr:hypothetical protein [uncultured prokaryote]
MIRTVTTIFEAARQRAGIRGAANALAFMVQWGMVRDQLDREPTIDDYREFWKVTRSTAFRHQSQFRAAFPHESTPSRLLDLASSQWDAKRGVAGLGATVITA